MDLVRTNYYQPYTGIYAPQTVVAKVGSATEDTRLRYSAYNTRGRVLTASMEAGPPTSYLWGHNGQYPIAEVENATPGHIAYAGFEWEDKGNWNYAGATVNDPTAPGGRRAYKLSGGSMQKTGLSSAQEYLLTYWVHPAAPSTVTVSGGTGAVISAARALGTYRGWTQYKRTIRSTTTVTISGGAKVDEVRLHPIGALMKTYTYDPLLGITSRTDASGSVTYYDYDTSGRLKQIRDLEDKIVEDYRYNYRQ